MTKKNCLTNIVYLTRKVVVKSYLFKTAGCGSLPIGWDRVIVAQVGATAEATRPNRGWTQFPQFLPRRVGRTWSGQVCAIVKTVGVGSDLCVFVEKQRRYAGQACAFVKTVGESGDLGVMFE